MRLYLVLVFHLFLYCFSAKSYAQHTETTNIPGKLVFKLKPEYASLILRNKPQDERLLDALTSAGAEDLNQKFASHTNSYKSDNPEAVDISLIYQITFNPALPFDKVKRQLLNTGVLEYVEPLRNYSLLHQPNDLYADSTVASYQYYLKSIKAYKAWDITKGDTNVVIGILDTGIQYNHVDLTGNIKYNYADPIDGIDNDHDGYVDNFRGWDLADNDNDATYSSIVGSHGVPVAGVSSATTNNAKGMAGIGYKCKFMPIKVYASTAVGTFSGYEALVYAADHGCNVINLSWGDPVAPSLYEQDLVNYAAINKNVVIVAAAGNTNAKLDFYPASYNNVVSVGYLGKNNVKAAAGTYSYKIDIGAYGEKTLSTASNSGTGTYSANVNGSSFASPMVAGAAALVRSKFPTYTGLQIAEQLRVTADASIYNLSGNANYANQLGSGLLNIAKAVTTTDAKSVRYTAVTLNNKGLFYGNDTIQASATFKNYLSPLSNLTVTVSSASPYVTVLQPTFQAGAMATLTTTKTVIPFKIKLASSLPTNEKLALKFTFTDGTYSDYQYYELFINPDFLTIDVNQVALSVNSLGNFGYNGQNIEQGIGFRYKNVNLLSEGGLMIGTSATKVSDNVRNADTNHPADNNFTSLTPIRIQTTAPYADVEAAGTFQDKYPGTGMPGVNVSYKAFAWKSQPTDKFVVLEYTLKNITPDTLKNAFAGLFADWDILDYSKNRAFWDAGNKMGYAFNVKHDTIYTGIQLLGANTANYYAFNITTPGSNINISDGYSDSEKYTSLSNGTTVNSAGTGFYGGDIAHTVSATLPNLAPNQETTIAFAVLAGDNLTDLQNSAEIAQYNYHAVKFPTVNNTLPVSLLNFRVSKRSENSAFLQWQTASEHNNAAFIIERSADGKNFEKIGSVEGAGNSNQLLGYAFTDKNAIAGTNYYRLRQNDYDGNFTYSTIKTITFEKVSTVSLEVYPNPFKEAVEFNLKLKESKNLQLSIYDNVGRLVATPLPETQITAGNHKIKYSPAQNLPAGVYIYKLTTANSSETGKIVLVK